MLERENSFIESKVGKDGCRLKFNTEKWVVSLLNTGGTIIGAHAKIIIEGLKPHFENNSFELFVAEYHIMESGSLQSDGGTLPAALFNVKGKALIIIKERQRYGENEDQKGDKLRQYANCTSSSWLVDRVKVEKMIKNIKDEKANFDDVNNPKDFQYAGNYRMFSKGKGHNCITWCMEKLEHADIYLKQMPIDNIKAIPEKHANSTVAKNYDVVVEKVNTCNII